MVFSVQNKNFMFSVEFLADLVQMQVRETVCGVILARHPNPILAHNGGDAQGFQRRSYNSSTPSREPTWRMQMMGEVAEHVGMNYPETPDSRYVAQPVDDFLFPWEEGFVDNPITIEEDEGFSEPRTLVSQPPVMEASPALRFIENLQNFENSAARQLFDL